jgi:hypothetical protein
MIDIRLLKGILHFSVNQSEFFGREVGMFIYPALVPEILE